jgi:acetylornithine deacetylase/succinyl-diaminopimelate desuccinylase-like protein
MLQSIRSTMAVVTLVTTCTAHGEPLAAEDLRRAVETNLGAAVALYREFLSLPNDAVHRDDIEDLVTWLEHEFNSRDFETRRIPTAGSPALFARRSREGAGKTVLVYLQADGQPVDPRAWDQANP